MALRILLEASQLPHGSQGLIGVSESSDERSGEYVRLGNIWVVH